MCKSNQFPILNVHNFIHNEKGYLMKRIGEGRNIEHLAFIIEHLTSWGITLSYKLTERCYSFG